MIRIAVPNKGALSEPATAMLTEAGYHLRRDGRQLVLADPANDAEFFFLRPRDIAVYVGSGTLDVGFTGRDLLVDSEVDAVEVLPLGFARSTFRFAAPLGMITDVASLAGKRIATSYDGIVRGYLSRHGIDAEVVRLDGAVESSIQLGVADAIADVVETGSTLRAAGLEVFGDPILNSEAVLIGRPSHRVEDDDAGQSIVPGALGDPDQLKDERNDQPSDQTDRAARIAVLVRRLQGVLVARQYVMVDYDVRVDLVEQACAVTPGLESPTVSPLHDRGWVAVRSMVPRARTNEVMDELYDLGARAILITTIHACRI